MSDETCDMAVAGSDGMLRPCGKPAAAVIEDIEYGGMFPVCVEHLKPSRPISGQTDIFGGEA